MVVSKLCGSAFLCRYLVGILSSVVLGLEVGGCGEVGVFRVIVVEVAVYACLVGDNACGLECGSFRESVVAHGEDYRCVVCAGGGLEHESYVGIILEVAVLQTYCAGGDNANCVGTLECAALLLILGEERYLSES